MITNGLVPLAIVLLGLAGLDDWIRTAFRADREERILFVFIFLLTALIILTVIGIFFRGAGMELVWPWRLTAQSHG